MRHEAISRFFEKGLSVPEVALISGHRDYRMLFRYTHPLREKITIRRFTRYALGEGMEKRSEDFAAEVAKAAEG